MPERLHLVPIDGEHPGLAALAREASSDGFAFVARLIDEWKSGANRFDGMDEQLLGAVVGCELVGVCGINHDPYFKQEAIGRLRHLYVRKTARGTGVGSALVARLLDEGHYAFRLVRLRTDTADAAAFYEKRGFVRVSDETASHVKTLPSPLAG